MSLAVLVWVAGPLMAVADTSIGTGFTRSSTGGQKPIVKVKWEMDGPYTSLKGTDAQTVAKAQLNPTGKYQQGKNVAICAIVTDPDGMADIDSVYGDVFYPQTISLGPNHETGRQGCGEMVGTECRMTKLSKDNGFSLFCTKIRNNNNNLPVFNSGFDYDDVCAVDGELMKETAYVYCCDKMLSYEDPSGDYRVLVFAQDKNGVSSDPLENYMTYLDLTAFEVDFSSILYGEVKLNTHKIVNGNINFGDNLATVRNVGNTRLQMNVKQNDMGLGKTGDAWNVRYDARVGNSAADWQNYFPEELIALKKPLNLSETNEMDFSIDVYKFPATNPGPTYNGSMTLGAKKADHLICP